MKARGDHTCACIRAASPTLVRAASKLRFALQTGNSVTHVLDSCLAVTESGTYDLCAKNFVYRLFYRRNHSAVRDSLVLAMYLGSTAKRSLEEDLIERYIGLIGNWDRR